MKVKTYCVYQVSNGKVWFFRALNKPKLSALKRALKLDPKEFITVDRIKVLDFISKF